MLTYNKPLFIFSDLTNNINIFQKNGKAIFTGDLPDTTYLKIHKYIEEYFADYGVLEDKQRFIRLFQLKLIELEFLFYNKLKLIYLKNLNDYLKPYNLILSLGDFENILKNTTNNTNDIDSRSNTTTKNNATSNTFNRSISSDLPQSNVKNFLGGSPKDNYSWNYASNVVDGVGDSTANNTTNGNNITTSSNAGKRDTSENVKGTARNLILRTFNEDIINLIKIIDVLNFNDNLFKWLTDNLGVLFDY